MNVSFQNVLNAHSFYNFAASARKAFHSDFDNTLKICIFMKVNSSQFDVDIKSSREKNLKIFRFIIL